MKILATFLAVSVLAGCVENGLTTQTAEETYCGRSLWSKRLRGVPASRNFARMDAGTLALNLETGSWQDSRQAELFFFDPVSGDIQAQKAWTSELSDHPLTVAPDGSLVILSSNVAGSTVDKVDSRGNVLLSLKGPYNDYTLLQKAEILGNHLLLATDGGLESKGRLWWVRLDGSVEREVTFELRTRGFFAHGEGVGVFLYDWPNQKYSLALVSALGEVTSTIPLDFDPHHALPQRGPLFFANGNIGLFRQWESQLTVFDHDFQVLNQYTASMVGGTGHLLSDGRLAVAETRVSTSGITFLSEEGKFLGHLQTLNDGVPNLALAQLDSDSLLSVTSEAIWMQGLGVQVSAALMHAVDLKSMSVRGTHRLDIPFRPKDLGYQHFLAGPARLDDHTVVTAYGLKLVRPTGEDVSRETVLVATDLSDCF